MSFGTWWTAALKGSQRFVHKWNFVVGVNTVKFFWRWNYDLCLRTFPLFQSVRCHWFILVLGWMMLYISVEALCKPQGTEGRVKRTPPPKKRVIVWVRIQTSCWREGGSFCLSCMFLSTPSIKHWAPTFSLTPLCSSESVTSLFSLLICTHFSLLSPWVGGGMWSAWIGGADMPAFHYPALREDGFCALSI